MATTLRRSKHHMRCHATLRHCVALVQWSDEKYSSHYEITKDDGTGTFYETGHYFDGPKARGEAGLDFTKRKMEFERRYAKFLEVDVHVLDDGSIMVLTPRTERATAHFEERMPDDVQMMGNGYAVERRYVRDIIDEMCEQGFTFTKL